MVVAASAGAGLVLRRKVSPAVGRTLLAVGFVALALGLVVLWLAVSGWGPLGFWTSALVEVVLLWLAAVTLPFGLVVIWGRPSAESDAG